MLEKPMQDAGINNLQMVPHQLITTTLDIDRLEREYILNGYEGVMVNPDIPYYKGKKSNKMLKFKTMLSMDCKVTGVYEGEQGKKFEGTLGGITVIQENGIECKVGSGFNEIKGSWKERDAIWGNPNAIIGRIVEIKFQELGSEGRMRFPIIMRYRDDKL
jgi:ATP-dependent DNA ligase